MPLKFRLVNVGALAFFCVAASFNASGQLIKTDLAEKENTRKVSKENTMNVSSESMTTVSSENTITSSDLVRKQRLTENSSLKNVSYQKDTVNQKSSPVVPKQEGNQAAPLERYRSTYATPSRWRKD